MKYKLPCLAAIFYDYFYRSGGGGMAPLAPPGSATEPHRCISGNSQCTHASAKVSMVEFVRSKFRVSHGLLLMDEI